MEKDKTQKKRFDLNRSWQYLFYLYLILPVLLFGLAVLTKSTFLGRMFHGYCLYVINPIPDWASKTGLLGAAMAAGFPLAALVRRRWLDLLLSLLLVALAVFCFWKGWNYLLVPYLRFA